MDARQTEGATPFVLHDGPPYPTGGIHYGTVLNKVLKDIVVRSQLLMGKRAVFRPGWDCHGLPIEQQVEKELGPRRKELDAAAFREHCEKHALKFVDVMRTEFKRLGCLGRWDDPYLTLSKDYEATIARQLAGFARAGLVYRDKKPVHWCLTHRTALAEAEVEYEDHASPSIYVRFPVVGDLGQGRRAAQGEEGGVRHLDDDPLDAAGQPGGRRESRARLRRDPARRRISARRGWAGRGVPGGDRDRGARRVVDRDLARRAARARGDALRAAVPRPNADGDKRLPALVRAPRDARGGHRASSTRRPVTAPTTTSSGASTGCTIFAPVDENGRFTGEVELGELNGAQRVRGQPEDRRASWPRAVSS